MSYPSTPQPLVTTILLCFYKFDFFLDYTYKWYHTVVMGFPYGSAVQNLPAMQEMQVWSLSWEDPLEKEMATHSCILAWEIPWMESLADYIPQGCKESDMTQATKQQRSTVLAFVCLTSHLVWCT